MFCTTPCTAQPIECTCSSQLPLDTIDHSPVSIVHLKMMDALQEEASGCAPRLWSPHGKFPGAAFSRSIGDAVAEEIGVTAQPELHTQRLTSVHPFFIIASDGLWEFVPSQTAVDMAMQYDDPQDAAAALVAEAQRRWLRADTRMDDITVIVVQVMVRPHTSPCTYLVTFRGIDLYILHSFVALCLSCTHALLYKLQGKHGLVLPHFLCLMQLAPTKVLGICTCRALAVGCHLAPVQWPQVIWHCLTHSALRRMRHASSSPLR